MHKELAKEWVKLLEELKKKGDNDVYHPATREYVMAEERQKAENQRLARKVSEL